MAKFDQLKKNLYEFYTKNKNLKKKQIFEKFEGLGASKSTLYSWLDQLENKKTLIRKKGNGRVPKKNKSKGKN